MMLPIFAAALLSSLLFAYLRPPDGTEDIRKLVADSALVCKGEVIQAPGVVFSSDPQPPHKTADALVHLDRCFKGEPPAGEVVQVLFDNILPPAGGPYIVLRNGDYRLFFLKNEGTKYILTDDWFGQLAISRLLATITESTDPMIRLEMDLKAGLGDKDKDRVLDSVRMLGNMRHLQSKTELISLLQSRDELVRTYVFEAMLRLHDYSVLPAVEQWLATQPQPPFLLVMPRDALFEMQGRLAGQVSLIVDPAALPILLRLLQNPNPYTRQAALQAVRTIKSPKSVPALLKVLDDSNADNAFIAMQALIELAGGGPIRWVPTLLEFRQNPAYYAATCRSWWEAGHKPDQ